MGLWDDEPIKRTLGTRDRQILWRRANCKCEACDKEIGLDEMQVGHDRAFSKGGKSTFKNAHCVCWRCNKLQGTDSWRTFMKKLGKEPVNSNIKKILKELTMRELKFLAAKHRIKIKGTIEDDNFSSYRKAPSKTKYIKKLSKVLSEKDINSDLKEIPKPEKKRHRKRRESFWF